MNESGKNEVVGLASPIETEQENNAAIENLIKVVIVIIIGQSTDI